MKWSPQDDAQLYRLLQEKRAHADIARQMGRGVDAVEHRIRRLKESAGVRPKHQDSGGDIEIPITVDEPVSERRQPEKSSPDDIANLLKHARRGLDLENLCDRLGCTPRRTRELIAEAQAKGHIVAIEGSHVGFRPPSPNTEAITVPMARAGEQRIFAIMSDIHVGSKWFLKDQFIDFIERAYDAGVRTIVSPGDLIDGNYKFLRWEQPQQGFSAQTQEFARILPRKPGLSYWCIGGNHDESACEGSGIDVCPAMEEVFRSAGRDDFRMIGIRGGKLRLARCANERGLIVELWHPKGGGAYALSYKLQKKIEGMALGSKPDVLAMGHFHQHCYFTQRGVHAISSGTFHGGQSPFGLALGTAPAIGGWIVRYAQTPDGTVRNFAPEWVAYYESEHVRVAVA